ADTIALTAEDWGSSHRTLAVGTRDAAALLTVHENSNSGWSATLDGEPLESVTVDGWQQGFVVPAGAPGTIELRFEPSTGYRAALIVGGCLVVLLAVGALLDRRRPATAAAVGPGRWPPWLPWAGGLVLFGAIGGLAG